MADAEHAAKLDAEKRTAEVAKLKDGDDDD